MIAVATNYDDVLAQLQAAGLIVSSLDTGRMFRCRVEGGGKEKRGWYSLHELVRDDGSVLLVGSFGQWRGAENNAQKVALSKSERLTPEQQAALKARMAEDKRKADAEQKARNERAAREAARMWHRLSHEGDCAYLRKKGVAAHGVRFTPSGNMALPLLDARGAIHGLQIIYADKAKKGRDKDFWPAGLAKKGHWFQIGSPDWICLVAEGYATAASLHEATGLPVAVAFDAGNLVPVSIEMHKRYPRAKLLICADDDYHSPGNAGITAANAAAVAVGGAWIAPKFATERPADKKGPTDFNDLHALEGLHVVRTQIETRLTELQWCRVAPSGPSAAGGEGSRSLTVDGVESMLARYTLVYGANSVAFDEQEHMLVKLSDVRDACLNKNYVRDWQADSRRRVVRMEQVGFDPTERDTRIKCNLWAGWPTVPQQGNCEKLLALLEYLTAGEDNAEEIYTWVLRWLAYPIQHPGAKMKTALVVHGPQGGGKNLFFEAVRDIYGEYGSTVDQAAIEDKHNDWAGRKLFLIADEVVARQEMHHIKNKLKGMVTSDKLRINPKHVTAHDERNHINLVFLSNEAQPLVLERDDRRYLVVWTPPAMPKEYYQAAAAELEDGGLAALHHFLLNLDLGDFGPNTKPPMTTAKQTLIQTSEDSAESFVLEWIAGQIDGIPLVPARSEDVYAIYKRWADRNGHRYIHSKNQFITRAMRMPGMSKRERQLYMDGDNRKQASFLFPPGVDQGDKSHSAWLTDSAALFAECAKDWNRP